MNTVKIRRSNAILLNHRFAFKVLYIGAQYFGFQRQLNGKSVENFLELAFIKCGYIHSFQDAKYKGSSRTDAKVNALGNIFALDCQEVPNPMRLNNNLPYDIIIMAMAKVSADFNPRATCRKVYWYSIPDYLSSYQIDRLQDFVGTHDFRNFIKNDGAGEHNPVNTVIQVAVEKTPRSTDITITGSRFGREQIRRIIGFVLSRKHASMSVQDALSVEILSDLRAAPPQFLWLVDISYKEAIAWEYTRHINHKLNSIKHQLRAARQQHHVLYYVLDSLLENPDMSK